MIRWERCDFKDAAGRCSGIRLGDDGNCLAHTRADQRALALSMFRAGADLDFTLGVPLTKERLHDILEFAPVENGRPVLKHAPFGGATFSGDADFTEAAFSEEAYFAGATFSGDAYFSGATFSGEADFSGATFSGDADFSGATFSGDAFSRDAYFRGATFRGNADFSGATFSEDADFTEAAFRGEAVFSGAPYGGATFSGNAWFDVATFSGNAGFSGVTFGGHAWFNEATFEGARNFGPVVVAGELSFDKAVFSADIDIEGAIRTLSCRKTRFRDEVNFRVRWADVTLGDADFASACLVDRAPSVLAGLDESKLADAREPEGQPRIVSLRRSNVASVVLGDVDLRACRFAGAHGLDGLRIESTRQLAERPKGWKRQLAWPPLWRWTARRAVAEEHEWRCKNEQGIRQAGWYPHACEPPTLDEVTPLSPADIQNIYRDLRKGREDRKDEPGAADFYFGEMEMRRAVTPRSFERVLLWLYWLVSGYGLRASRALAALLVLIGLTAWGFSVFGFAVESSERIAAIDVSTGEVRYEVIAQRRPPYWDRYWDGVVHALGRATSVIGASERELTDPGRVLETVVRVLGPVLIGLALLSLRGRVKR